MLLGAVAFWLAITAVPPTVSFQLALPNESALTTTTSQKKIIAINYLSDSPSLNIGAPALSVLPGGKIWAVWSADIPQPRYRAIYSDVWHADKVWGADHAILVQKSPRTGMPVDYLQAAAVVPLAHDARKHVVFYADTMRNYPQMSHLKMIVSTDGGTEWSLPHRIYSSPLAGMGLHVRHKPLFYADGSIGIPAIAHILGSTGLIVRFNSDYQVTGHNRIRTSVGSAPCLVPLNEKTIVSLQPRSNRSPQRFEFQRRVSTNSGQLWQSDFTDLRARTLSIVALPKNRELIAVLNNNTRRRARDSLALAISNDQGKHWRTIYHFEHPSAIQNQPQIAHKKNYMQEIERTLVRDQHMPDDHAQRAAWLAASQLCYDGICRTRYRDPWLLRDEHNNFHLIYVWNDVLVKHIQFNQAWLNAVR